MTVPARPRNSIPASLPQSWSKLTWQQLCTVWEVKQRYGGNPDVARVAAFLVLTLVLSTSEEGKSKAKFKVLGIQFDENTGESVYTLIGKNRQLWTVTARNLAHMAKQAIPWFDYPYGDPGEKEKKDEKGKVVKESREPHRGYVSGMRDAMILPIETLTIKHRTLSVSGSRQPWWRRMGNGQWRMFNKHFALPQVAMNNLTWQQYRALQAIVPQLFQEDNTEEQTIDLQAQFLAHTLVPRTFALLDSSGKTIKVRPHWVYEYDAGRAEKMVKWWEKQLSRETIAEQRTMRHSNNGQWSMINGQSGTSVSVLFHICFQCYQTAVSYYAAAYPLLFNDDNKQDPMRDALQGEVGTINTIMKYAGYAEQQQVYDSNLPFVLDILNTMTKEAKEIEKMKSKTKSKR